MGEEQVEGTRVENIDAPAAMSAEEFTEDTDHPFLESNSYGPTDSISSLNQEAEEELVEELVEEEQKPVETKSEEEKPVEPKTDPDALKKAQMYDWIIANPEKFAAMKAEQVENKGMFEEPQLGKDPSEVGDQELFEHLIGKKVHELLSPVLPGLIADVESSKQFQGKVENALMKQAIGADGKPVYPRWDELSTVTAGIQHQYPGMSQAEAYILADRQMPSAHVVEPTTVVEQPPRKPTPAQTRAASLTQFGRSSQVLKDGPKNLQQSIEAALDSAGIMEG